MITDLFIEQFYWLVLSLLRLDLSSDFDLDCVRSVGRFIDVITFDFLLGLTFVWFDHSLVRLGLFSRFRSLSRKLMRSFGRWQVISLFNVCVFNFLFFFLSPVIQVLQEKAQAPQLGRVTIPVPSSTKSNKYCVTLKPQEFRTLHTVFVS